MQGERSDCLSYFRNFILITNMNLQLALTTNVYDRENLLLTCFNVTVKSIFYDEENDKEENLELGFIVSYRFDLEHSPRKLFFLADSIDGDLMRVADFFLGTKTNYQKIFGSKYLFYINYVFIKPEFRNRGYTLQSVALFLELFAKGEVVSCHPVPMDDLKKKFSKSRGKSILRRYWSKLGLTYYSKKHNILWQEEWSMPKWLESNLLL